MDGRWVTESEAVLQDRSIDASSRTGDALTYEKQLLWTLVVLLLPLLGQILWCFLDPRSGRT